MLVLAAAITAGFLIPPAFAAPGSETPLESGWTNPPVEARLRAYWWWLNGNVTTQAITRDLEEMKTKGFGGAVIIDANGAAQEGNSPVPHGPAFFSPEWRALYKHALAVAHRLGFQMSLNIQSGWNLGGPVVQADDASKTIAWSELRANGPAHLTIALPFPKRRDSYYRDAFVVAYRLRANPMMHRPLENWAEKALYKSLQPSSAPDTAPLFQEYPATADEEDVETREVVDISSRLGLDGKLDWDVPTGQWQILRFGWTIGPNARVSTSSDGWHGYALDVFDAGAFNRYWRGVVQPLIADAGPLAGTTLKYLHTDSWEIEGVNWTPSLPVEFKRRFGYSMIPFLPVLAGRIVNSREISDRFLEDYRKTLGDLTIEHHYKLFRNYAHRRGLLIHPESGGPHAVPIDAQRDLGWDDAPMSEFWAWSWEHRIGNTNRFFMKQPASAAHTYGHRFVFGEGFTSIGPHWQSRLADNLKPAFDKALCEGLNMLVWHAFVCSPQAMGIPGQQYFAGTHLNPNDTWWPMSAPFFAYIDRCQFLLQRGLPISDAVYYYGDHVPNFAQLRSSDPAQLGPGYDYDVITEEAVLTRLAVKNRRLVLPDGVSYHMMIIPDRDVISLPVLRKLKQLVAQGATVLGSKPARASGLKDYPQCDQQVQQLANELWGPAKASLMEHRSGKGKVITGRTGRDLLLAAGIPPDFTYVESAGIQGGNSASPAQSAGQYLAGREPSGGAVSQTLYEPTGQGPGLDYIHRRDGATDIYFLAHGANEPASFHCTFRVSGKRPELWDPVSGRHWVAAAYTQANGSTTLSLDFAACGSMFVIFRNPAPAPEGDAKPNFPVLAPVEELAGPWTVSFDPRWGGPPSATFDKLESWTARADEGTKYYSGTAVYRKTFSLPANHTDKEMWIDLGDVREVAQVKLNGQSLGIVWTLPYRVDATKAIHSGANQLEVKVVNFWCNRIIGDQFLPPYKRFTQTNIRKLTQRSPLMVSGLLGPVRVLREY